MSLDPIVLAAVDLDRRAIPVIVRAARLAATCNGHPILAHVVDYRMPISPDTPFPERADRVRDSMVRHARASLVGMACGLDLPTEWLEIRLARGRRGQVGESSALRGAGG